VDDTGGPSAYFHGTASSQRRSGRGTGGSSGREAACPAHHGGGGWVPSAGTTLPGRLRPWVPIPDATTFGAGTDTGSG
jgi:hypothetical protein